MVAYRTKLVVLFPFALALAPALGRPGDRSADGVWFEVDAAAIPVAASPSLPRRPQGSRVFQVDLNALDTALAAAPLRFASAGAPAIVTIPMPDGSYQRFEIEEHPLLSKESAAQRPDIKNYSGWGIDDPTASIALDRMTTGFHAMILSPHGTVYVDPVRSGDAMHHRSAYASASPQQSASFIAVAEEFGGIAALPPGPNPSGDKLRAYRLVISATGEYTTFFGGEAGAQNQINTTINRVRGIFEREISISFEVIFNIYLDPDTDPFPTGTEMDGAILMQNQTALDTRGILCLDGSGCMTACLQSVGGGACATGGPRCRCDADGPLIQFEIGHVFSQDGGPGSSNGAAGGRGPCTTDNARGGTLSGDWSEGADILAAQEIAHQFSAAHTLNGSSGICSSQRVKSNAYEPGSGTTIMGYPGACPLFAGPNQNCQCFRDPYFHTAAFDRIRQFVTTTGSMCGNEIDTNNAIPTVEAGLDCATDGVCTIPRDTPFKLTAVGNDANGDAITYCWEQFDKDDQSSGSSPGDNTNGPLFRSFLPVEEPTRIIPQLSILVGGQIPECGGSRLGCEILTNNERDINFRVTVRDGKGGVDWDAMKLKTKGAPFRVTFPNGEEDLDAGSTVTVKWDRGGSDPSDPVNILFSPQGKTSTRCSFPGPRTMGCKT